MPYLRLVADRRGVEHTYLLHTAAPGEKTKILYWFRTAPGLRIGRQALDDSAMRMLEEQYPDIDFDWQYILDMGAMTPVEVEAPVPLRKRKPAPRPQPDADGTGESAPTPASGPEPAFVIADADPREPEPEGAGPVGDLLAELLGRGIAADLRARYAELEALMEAAPADPAVKAAWQERLAAVDPDAWESPEAVLAGMARFETDAEALRRTVEQAGAGA
ncbi:MAG: hypothetical protein R2708_04435 [Vicinamibacterales bacterium]